MRMAALAVLGLAGLALPASAAPPMPAYATDRERCTWEWKTGAGLGVWTERCALETGLWEVVPRDGLPGFVLTIDGRDEVTVLQVFDKPSEAGIEAILPTLRREGAIPDDEDCVFEPAAIRPAPRTVAFYEIRPTGARRAAFEATPADEIPEPPCGDYGWSTHGIRYFMTDLRFPGRVVYVDTGEDGLMFDPASVTLE